MDKSIYVAMSGARETLRAQASNSHNLANASTTGFRADLSAFMSRAIEGPGFDSRAYATTSTVGWDQTNGATLQTGRDLDVAVKGEGWIAVQAPDGTEAYTRAGDLQIDVTGQLRNGSGHAVVGDSGPIVVPPNGSMLIGSDGTISVVPLGQGPQTMANVGRIKLVNPEANALTKGLDGLFRTRNGEPADADPNVRVADGTLEGSNVNVVEAMVGMIAAARQFEMQMKMLAVAEQNEQKAGSLLSGG